MVCNHPLQGIDIISKLMRILDVDGVLVLVAALHGKRETLRGALDALWNQDGFVPVVVLH
jgi:hypothetical protein